MVDAIYKFQQKEKIKSLSQFYEGPAQTDDAIISWYTEKLLQIKLQ